MPLDYQTVILTQSVRLLEMWGEILRIGTPMDGRWLWLKNCYDNAERNTTAFQTRHFGIPYAPSEWLDRRPTPAESQGFSRAIRQLASLDLIKTVARFAGSRTTHYQLTPAGLRVGLKLTQAADVPLDQEAVQIALQHTKWATDEHLAAVRGPQEPKA